MIDAAKSASAPVLVEAQDLTRDYVVGGGMFRGGRILRAVAGATFNVVAGRTLAVVGESGCGKSTLARMVTMIERPTSGRLLIDGSPVEKADAETLKRLRPVVQMVFQNPYASLNPRKQVGQILEEPLVINTSLDAKARRKAAQEMMAKVGLRPEFYQRYPQV